MCFLVENNNFFGLRSVEIFNIRRNSKNILVIWLDDIQCSKSEDEFCMDIDKNEYF